MSEIFQQIVDLVIQLGYMGIFLLMTLESSFIPFPSEIVLIPAGAAAKQGHMNAYLVVLAGVGGSLCGAFINYYLSLTLGRGFILRYGHYFLLSEEKFLKVERAFLKHGNFATFVGRLIFGIRQWVSIPAGLSKMPLVPFGVLTTAGAGLWVIILVALGFVFGATGETTAKAKQLGVWILGAAVVMTVAYYLWNRPKRNQKSDSQDGDGANGNDSLAA